jgi:hypothetical protein
MTRRYFWILLVSSGLWLRGAAITLEGCPDPAKIGRALGELHHRSCANMSLTEIEKIWPTNLRGDSYEPHHIRLFSEDRIIGGKLECGTALRLNMPTGDVDAPAQLESIIVNYTTATPKERDSIERLLVDSVHPSEHATRSFGVSTAHNGNQAVTGNDPFC